MIEYIQIINTKNENLKLYLKNPELSNNISIRDVQGLGYKGQVNTTQIINIDGEVFNNQILDKRNITMILGVESSKDVEKTRHLIYNYFPSREKIRFIIKTNNVKYYIDGYIESCDPTIFDKAGDETIQISIICPYPYFKEYDQFIEELSGSLALFYFPFWNESDYCYFVSYSDLLKKQMTWGGIKMYRYDWLLKNEL